MTHGDCLTSSNSGGRGKSQRTQPRRAPFLPCPEPPGSSPASTGLQASKRKRENRSSQRWFCNSSSAGDTRSRRPQTPQGCARRRRRQTHRRGSPTLDTAAASWEAQETPGSVGSLPAPSPLPQRQSGAGHGAPTPAGTRGSPKSPGEELPRSRGRNPFGVPASTASALTRRPSASRHQGAGSRERSRPGGRGSGARGDGSGHSESRAEAETLPGAPD
ncbi:PREDICTED: translation initiation factor IF-2-like isoform X1 [Rhinopithecus bieti]|uniref:translation initiation factor IF-2-like isoform X1 n=1 Tax=Rhinopithecus bieti TaxID=61621 RepID=UPI00083BE587|nr:PREDICTED: translation initiation factor IF-2-like isoform X1 [Rhinopithecus bieti]